MAKEYVIGVDAGTASVRAGVFDLKGKMHGLGTYPLNVYRIGEDIVEQSSEEIWRAAGRAIRKAMRESGIDNRAVIAINFDATCSLVALDRRNEPISVSPTGDRNRNVIVWMDHRAHDQAKRINATGHRVLRFVGGQLSPEQQPPKLLWIKEKLWQAWQRSGKFLDLADFLTFKACGEDVRSLCTTVCKWTYLGHEGNGGSWDASFFEQIGLADLFEGNRAGTKIMPLGREAGTLTAAAGRALGLREGVSVGVGIIDAHAGGIGVLGMPSDEKELLTPAALRQRVALIGGTSSCHMAASEEPLFIPGIWGPYYGAMIPGMWLTEGGQSATGALIDFIVESHSMGEALKREARNAGKTVYDVLNGLVSKLGRGEPFTATLTRDLHVLPYFHGNRSPRANPNLKGIVSGLRLDLSAEALARMYYATIQAIAYGTRHILEEMNRAGYQITKIHACGGGTKNRLWLQEHADATGCEIILPREPEAVLLGCAILAAVAAGRYGSVLEGMERMSRRGGTVVPQHETFGYHNAKYEVFQRMYAHQVEYEQIVQKAHESETDVKERREKRK